MYDVNLGVVANILIDLALLDRKFNLPIKHFLATKALTAALEDNIVNNNVDLSIRSDCDSYRWNKV